MARRPVTGPILDSSGRYARGMLKVKASRAFEIAEGLVTEAVATIAVRDGSPEDGWTVPVTPEGTTLTIWQDLDGETLKSFKGVFVPDGVGPLTYAQLLYNRGEGVGGPNPYMWDLTGGLDFPDTAVDGDYGFDSDTGQVWRYDA